MVNTGVTETKVSNTAEAAAPKTESAVSPTSSEVVKQSAVTTQVSNSVEVAAPAPISQASSGAVATQVGKSEVIEGSSAGDKAVEVKQGDVKMSAANIVEQPKLESQGATKMAVSANVSESVDRGDYQSPTASSKNKTREKANNKSEKPWK